MTTARSISRSAVLRSNRPAPGFDENTQLNAGSIGGDLGPFVDLAEFEMSRPVFRPHPHAGFSAVTYPFEDSPGRFRNRWSMGDSVTIPPGALHWTQAGSGMLHEEVPIEPGIICHGVQVFVKLAAADEIIEPESFHVHPADVVELSPAGGVRIRLLAGDLGDASAGIAIRHDLTFAEIHLEPGATVELPAGAETNAFVFVQRGTVESGPHTVGAKGAATFAADGDHVSLTAIEPTSLLFGAGAPLDTDSFSSGPFIMSTPKRSTTPTPPTHEATWAASSPPSDPTPLTRPPRPGRRRALSMASTDGKDRP